MARHLTKYRRFVLDTNHVDSLSMQATGVTGSFQNSPSGSGAPGAQGMPTQNSAESGASSGANSSAASGGTQKTGGEGRKCNRTYISAIKSFS